MILGFVFFIVGILILSLTVSFSFPIPQQCTEKDVRIMNHINTSIPPVSSLEPPLIVLIISSSDVPEYASFKDILRQCMRRSDMIYFFVEFVHGEQCDTIVSNDVIQIAHPTKTELVQNIFYKTVEAMKYIHQNYDYKILLRTNLSSFWNMSNLKKQVESFDENTFGGYRPFGSFVSGTSIFMGKNVVKYICDQNREYSEEFDDVLLSQIASTKFPLTSIDNSKVHFYTFDTTADPLDFHAPLFYRIKNEDRSIDVQLFKKLAFVIYDIVSNAEPVSIRLE